MVNVVFYCRTLPAMLMNKIFSLSSLALAGLLPISLFLTHKHKHESTTTSCEYLSLKVLKMSP